MELGDHPVGGEAPVFVIAEAGVNHNGDPDLAHRLVDAASQAGADAVKFQTFEPDLVVTASSATADYQADRTGVTSQRDLLAGLTLPGGTWEDLSDHAADRDLVFLSTPFDERSLEIVTSLGVEAIKVPSGEVTNLPFLREVAATGLPVVLSTGMATLEEVDAAVAVLDAPTRLCILHCVTAYPAPAEESNLRVIPALHDRYGVPAGWSDHTLGEATAIAAVALGAAVLEKHVTLDRAMKGPDHAASLDPEGLRSYVLAVRTVRQALGDGVKQPVPSERPNMEPVRRSWHAARDLGKGDQIGEGDVIALRPASGISPAVRIVGRRLIRSVERTQPITEEMLGPTP